MIIFDIADRIRDYLNKEVCPQIELKQANEEETNVFELVHPTAYSMFRPRAKSEKQLSPSITVIPPGGSEPARIRTATGECSIRLLFLIWDPGQHERREDENGVLCPLTFASTSNGWRDLANAIDATIRMLQTNFQTKTGLAMQGDIKYSLFVVDENGNPLPEFVDYYAGWIDFTVSHGVARNPDFNENL